MKKRICAITGSRSDYDLLYPVLKKIKSNGEFELQLLVTGNHFTRKFGLTYKEIENDGFSISERVRIDLSDDSEEGVARALGQGVIGSAKALRSLTPDIILALGDRYETFSAVIAGFISKIPIVHIHGGELTEGLIDDAIRHSITKMSFLHFTSTMDYRNRVIQLGESPETVFYVGATGVDNIKHSPLLSRVDLERELGFNLGKKSLLVAFHPVTLEGKLSCQNFKEMLCAIETLKGVNVIFTKPNADMHGDIICHLIDGYVKRNPSTAKVIASMGRIKYLSTLKFVDVMLGNSSSGIIEFPSFFKPTVNVGDRQRGRIRAGSVIDCPLEKKQILKALSKAFSDKFRNYCLKVKNPYGDGRAAEKIYSIIRIKAKGPISLKKSFFDIKF